MSIPDYRADSVPDSELVKADIALAAARWALVIVFLCIVIKTYGYVMSGSAALMASLVDSIGDAAISLMSLTSILISIKPADEEHRFGHGKAEGFSALFQSAFLCGAGVFITFETVQRFFDPVEMSHHALGIGVSGIVIILTLILVCIQKRAVARSGSLAVEADQYHYKSDVAINGGVIIALAAHAFGGWAWVDLAVGLMIAGYMALTAFTIAQKAADMLMDREIDEADRARIIEIVEGHDQVLGMHDLRTRRAGMNLYISFDIELDGSLSLEAAHDISKALDTKLLAVFPHAEIIIHKDPQGDIYDPRHKVHGVHH